MLLLFPCTAVRAQAPAGFVDAAAVVPGLVVDMRYFGDNNFVGERIDGYERPRCLLTAQAAEALARVQRDLSSARPRAQSVRLLSPGAGGRSFPALGEADRRCEEGRIPPGYQQTDLFRLGYLATRSGHSRGSTVDLTLVRRADNSELDMGTIYDFAGRQSWVADKTVSVEAQKNRALFAQAMVRGGFRPYHKEWWHFTLVNEPFPDTYFDFPVR